MRKLVQEFFSTSRGNVAIITALCAIPMMLMAGVALDYMRANRSEAVLQAAVDSAALAGRASPKINDETVRQMVSEYLVQNGAADITSSIGKVRIERPDDKTLKVTTEGRIPTTMMQLAGIEDMNIGAVSEVTRSYGELEVALVLDNTGSMRGAKLEALKDSAHLMVNELFSDHAGGVKVALIPFSQYVNVGLSRRDAPWMSVPRDHAEVKNLCSWVQPNPGNCRQRVCNGADDGKPITYQCQVCDGEWVERCSSQTVAIKWHGCVGSRDYPLDVEDRRAESPYPGILDASCANEIMPLTADRRRIDEQIGNMTATGETYIPGGLIWGWNAVSNAEPLSEGAAENEPQMNKAVVLMTDGENTLSPTYPAHDGADKSLANKLSLELCANIKEAGIKLFTVSFEVSDSATEDMLKACASGPDQYFNADDPGQLKTAFNAIAGALAQLRIAR